MLRGAGDMEDIMSDTEPVLVPDTDANLDMQRKIRRREGEGPSMIPTPEEARKAGLMRKVEDSGA